jgi:hypothetical protein
MENFRVYGYRPSPTVVTQPIIVTQQSQPRYNNYSNNSNNNNICSLNSPLNIFLCVGLPIIIYFIIIVVIYFIYNRNNNYYEYQ